ncbi:MAG: DUF22 domain-containing protein [Archaeoglobus sp.]|nr:DUF22 domain-containing protein [Archaeoglobus sp.]
MEASMVYWVDGVGGRIEMFRIELKPFGYRMGSITQWKTLVADENVFVERGKPAIIKVKTIRTPKNTMVGPLHIMRHALGTVVDVIECGIPTRVEEEKCISQVLFVSVESGEVKKGDLIGVLKVIFLRTGLLSRLMSVSTPEIELKEEPLEANLTWRDDGNVYREPIRTKVLGYTSSSIGVWKALVADENVELRKGEVVRIRVKDVNLPPNTLVVPLAIMRNAHGSVIDVVQLGKPKKLEEEKVIHQAVFLPIDDGIVEKGDLIGVLNVFYVGNSDLTAVLKEAEVEKVNVVYRSGKGVIKEEVKVEPFGYRRSLVASWEVLIANEHKKVRFGEPCIVEIKSIEIPKNTITYPLSIMRYAYGTFIDLVPEGPPKKIEEERIINKILFLPISNGEIREGQLLGVINLYPIEIGTLAKVRQWLDSWLDEMGRRLGEPDWPI